jgi:imidazole glycerol-phosphate synthase subunit HisH
MNKSDVVVIDYGIGNLLSVQRGLEYCGADVTVTDDKDIIMNATRVVLPGVGAFSDGMKGLNQTGLNHVVCDYAASGKPLLGICLGMQMLLNESEEFGFSQGLGLIPGKVIAIPSLNIENKNHKIPHIGWNSLKLPEGREQWDGTLLNNIVPGESVYFVHSFMAEVSSSEHQIAYCLYGGIKISAVIGSGNIIGCQFHPEKSGDVGLKILKHFINL